MASVPRASSASSRMTSTSSARGTRWTYTRTSKSGICMKDVLATAAPVWRSPLVRPRCPARVGGHARVPHTHTHTRSHTHAHTHAHTPAGATARRARMARRAWRIGTRRSWRRPSRPSMAPTTPTARPRSSASSSWTRSRRRSTAGASERSAQSASRHGAAQHADCREQSSRPYIAEAQSAAAAVCKGCREAAPWRRRPAGKACVPAAPSLLALSLAPILACAPRRLRAALPQVLVVPQRQGLQVPPRAAAGLRVQEPDEGAARCRGRKRERPHGGACLAARACLGARDCLGVLAWERLRGSARALGPLSRPALPCAR
jgi:hypothetical protein